MRSIILTCLLLLGTASASKAQKPKDGTYTYTIAFAEWGGKSHGNTCTVIIKGNKIKVINRGTGTLAAYKGQVLDEGILMIHQSGKWIIGHSSKDKYAKEIGGCSDGPAELDFKRKLFWIC